MATATTASTLVKNLMAGDVIVNPDSGTHKIVEGYPQKCKTKGYIRVVTTNGVIDCHGSRVVQVLVRR